MYRIVVLSRFFFLDFVASILKDEAYKMLLFLLFSLSYTNLLPESHKLSVPAHGVENGNNPHQF